MKLLRHLTVDPVNLSKKGKLHATLACFCSILLVALFTHALIANTAYPIIVASMGASTVILFIIPNSPLAQPWPFVGGQLTSALVGMTCALNINDTAFASSVAVGASVGLMLLLRCLHPPGAATSLAPILGGDSINALGYGFVLFPVGANVLFMLLLTIAINRWLLKRNYPSPLPQPTIEHQRHTISHPCHRIGITEQDIEQTLDQMDMFVDLTHADLSRLLSQAEMNTFRRIRGDLSCADIMISNVVTVEYGTEVEDAWKIMYSQNLKVMPVIDRARRVIGIITWHDFFKFLDLKPYQSLQHHFRQFVRRTADLTTHKPESVGQIMSTSVVALPAQAHIVELIPLMSIQGHRQVPIVDEQQKLVGMVYQANLIAALYNDKLASAKDTNT